MTEKVLFVEELKRKTKHIALRIIKLSQTIPYTRESTVIVKQLIRSGTSVGANYRAACRARSQAEFFSKISIVIEEADETQYWFDLLIEAEIVDRTKLEILYRDLEEVIAILTISRKSLSDKNRKT